MDRFAYLVDETELGDLRPDWPAGVSVALCLDAGGEAGLVLFESGDHEGLAVRIASSTGWEPGSFAVTPEIEGCPTLRPLFSQAQDFLHIVARFDGLEEMAQQFLGVEEAAQDPGEPLIERETRSRLNLSLPQGGSDLPDGYRSAEDLAGVAFARAEIRAVKDHVRVVMTPEKAGRRTPVVPVQHVGFRDDLRCFVLQPETLGAWQPGHPVILDIPEARFPAALAARLKAGNGGAEVTVTPEGVFVTPVLAAELDKPARKAPRGALRMTLVVGVAMGLLSGSVVTALQGPSSGQNDILAYRAAPGNSGLNVLESFARSLDTERKSED